MDKTLGKIACGYAIILLPYGRMSSTFCVSFIDIYDDKKGKDINLNEAAEKLEVERRRIYDIVNVFESLEIVRRKAKNTYIWQGVGDLRQTLGKLKV